MTQEAKNSNNAQGSHWCFSISSNANLGVGSGVICYFCDQGLYKGCERLQPKRSWKATNSFLNAFPWSSSSALHLQAEATGHCSHALGIGVEVRNTHGSVAV